MSKQVASIDNLTNPGLPPVHDDRIRTNYTDGTYRESYYYALSITPGAGRTRAPVTYRVIATKAFYRRMTQVERTTLRGTADENINDLRDDLQRSPTVDLDDPELLTMLQATPLSGARITELLADGTEDERFVNVAAGT